jgi:hypothetical protein
MATVAAEGAVDPTADVRPYAPSWVNRIIDRIDRLPGPTWAAYLAIGAGFLVIAIAQSWVAGIAPVGVVDPNQAFWGLFVPLTLWLFHYLDGVAREALRAFRPALGGSDADVERLGYELTVVPARPALAILITNVILTPSYYLLDPVAADVVGLPPFGLAMRYFSEVLFGSFTFVLVYHSVRQMRAVGRSSAQARGIDLFHPDPLYAFARLTARTGIIILLVFITPTVATPAIFESGAAWVWGVYVATGIAIAIAVFVLPLRGMHARLMAEKARLVYDSENRVKSLLAELNRDVDGVIIARADGLNKLLASLLQQREVLANLPTWPWSPGTLRGFLSVILLPIGLFVVQRLLSQVV